MTLYSGPEILSVLPDTGNDETLPRDLELDTWTYSCSGRRLGAAARLPVFMEGTTATIYLPSMGDYHWVTGQTSAVRMRYIIGRPL
ncbi:hypothetical protein CY34DRAFT_799202 [Suillus luteus UH-Slu-Lm8-n1]|uniref:Uncharacterized protein n=1 Tax=Suillus luteus UH-Slu-Lm8-n1 TaxID=930992 RepID=A0A0D0BP50_9AGAM|nr:hypothetical protein CY34DRAFT_799202 [Suillus luteus UH-Slu-Lm8-n1]